MSAHWRSELSRALTSASAAWRRAGRTEVPEGLDRISRAFSVRIPDYYLSLIDPKDPLDPIALQSLPSLVEGEADPTDLADAVGDRSRSPVPGLVVKHPNRVILLASNTCTMYCRFCFRRPVATGNALGGVRDGLNQALDWIRAHHETREVILSGGDPLTLDDHTLGDLLGRIRAIPHIRLIRLHTRAPVTLPARVTEALADLLRRYRPIYVVTHFNHPREVTPEAREGLATLSGAALPLLNQSVLLKRVNDSARTLAELGWRLLENGVTPYYLHHCDRTPGTGPFRVAISRGRAIVQTLRSLVPGHGLPRYVIDLPNGCGKVDVMTARALAPCGIDEPKGIWEMVTSEGIRIVFHEESGEVERRAPPLPPIGDR